MVTKTELYSREETERLKKRKSAAKLAALITGALGLAVCVVLCCVTNTLNAQRMEYTAVIVSTLSGWIVIFLILNLILPSKYEAEHAENVLNAERVPHSGTVTVDKAAAHIKNSISVCRVSVSDGTRLFINSRKAAALRGITVPVTLYSAHGYVAAYEVEHEQD